MDGPLLRWAEPVGPDPRPAPPDLPPAAPQPVTGRRIGLEAVAFVAVVVVVLLLMRAFVVEVRFIPSGSMLPQLQIDDRVAVSKLAYRLHPPRRGDIVVFDPPGDEVAQPERPLVLRLLRALGEGIAVVHPSTEDHIKRIVALPGETVEGRDGAVFVDGRRLAEPYLEAGVTTEEFPPVLVPEGAYWVMGDNRPNSSDSRAHGPIRRDAIVGRAVVRMWPLHDASFL